MKKNLRKIIVLLMVIMISNLIISSLTNAAASEEGLADYILNGESNSKIVVGRCSTGYSTGGNTYISFGNETIGVNDGGGVNNPEAQYYNLPDGKIIKDVQKGFFHTVILTTDGCVYTLGDNEYGQLGNGTYEDSSSLCLVEFDALNPDEEIMKISANGHHTLALGASGNLYGWGRNDYSQLYYEETENYPFPVLLHRFNENIAEIEAGGYSSFVITENGNLYGWGFNGYGNLGIGYTERKNYPYNINLFGEELLQFSAGRQHAMMLTKSGKVYTWGRNDFNQITDTDMDYYSSLYEIPSSYYEGNRILSVKAGGNGSCVITDEDIYIWGNTEKYFGAYANLDYVVKLSDMLEVSDSTDFGKFEVALGENHFMIKTDKGKIYTCGKNGNGQLSLGTISQSEELTDVTEKYIIDSSPFEDLSKQSLYVYELEETRINQIDYYITKENAIEDKNEEFVFFSSNEDVIKINKKTGRITSVLNEGEAYIYAIWQENESIIRHELSNEEYSKFMVIYHVIVCKNNINSSSGKKHSFYFDNDKVIGWGHNGYGQLGYGSDETVLNPVNIESVILEKIKSIECGFNHTLILTENGKVYAFGHNDYGQLGDGTTNSSNTPILISGFDFPVKKISAGGRQSFAITEGGSVYSWGRNYYGQLGDLTTTTRTSPTNITSNFNGKKIRSIIAGTYTTYAISDDNKVFSWGFGSKGNLGDGTYKSKISITEITNMFNGETVIKLVAGEQHALALTLEKNVYGWGYNNKSQLGNNTINVSTPQILNYDESVDIFAGESNSGYKTANGNVYIFGDNSYCQLGVEESETISDISLLLDSEAKNISFGEKYIVITTCDDKVYTMGDNSSKQLGINPEEEVPGLNDITDIIYLASFEGGMSTKLNISNYDEEYFNTYITVNNMLNIGNKIFMVTYDPTVITLADGCAMTSAIELNEGKIEKTNLNILSVEDGVLKFKFEIDEEQGIAFSGWINAVKFKWLNYMPSTIIVRVVEE